MNRRLVGLSGFLALCALCSWSCGGGSGGGGATTVTDASTFNGGYFTVIFSSTQPGANSTSRFGAMVADGAGMVVPTTASNINGTYTPPGSTPALAYTVGPTGGLALPFETGLITKDGLAGVSMRTSAGSPPSMRFLLRPTGTFNNGVFSGTYHMGGLYGSIGTAGVGFWSTVGHGRYVANGAGSLAKPTNIEINGGGTRSTGSTGGGSTAYTVNTGGITQTGTLNATITEQGGITGDGSFVVCGGAESSSGPPYVMALIRVASGANLTTLAGTYLFVCMRSDPTDSGRWTSSIGRAVANGSGGLQLTGQTQNYETTISNPADSVDTYSVAADGTLTTGSLTGAVSQDGRFAFLAGDTLAGESPSFYLLVRE